jgi:hypothetical protein
LNEAETAWRGYLDEYGFGCFGGGYHPYYKGRRPRWLPKVLGSNRNGSDQSLEFGSKRVIVSEDIFFVDMPHVPSAMGGCLS